jgi:dTDP-4-amino-4,6-dideoxygalactose transaminase
MIREKYKVGLSGEVYELPIHQQPVFKPYVTEALPISEDFCARQICLPVYSGMEEIEAEQVIIALRESVG